MVNNDSMKNSNVTVRLNMDFTKKGWAFLTDEYVARGFISEHCHSRIKILSGSLARMPLHQAVKKGSPLKDLFTERIFHYHVSGKIAEWQENRQECRQDSHSVDIQQLGFYDLSAMFLLVGGIFLFGLGFSIIRG